MEDVGTVVTASIVSRAIKDPKYKELKKNGIMGQ